MWKLPIPLLPSSVAYKTCISSVKDDDLKKKLGLATPYVEQADRLYRAAGIAGQFGDLIPASFHLPDLSVREMSNVYESRMAARRSPGRAIYDSLRLSSRGGKCPLCGHRDVMTLDHYLPKSGYPALVVNPINLVPACTDCNKAKSSTTTDTLHPYYDDIEQQPWLYAEVIEKSPAAARFYVLPPEEWPEGLAIRVIQHFRIFGLGPLYSAQAARRISGIRSMLITLASRGSPDAVRSHLLEEASSWQALEINSWEAALYESLANSDWFCSAGFESY